MIGQSCKICFPPNRFNRCSFCIHSSSPDFGSLWNPSLRKTLSHPAAVHRQAKSKDTITLKAIHKDSIKATTSKDLSRSCTASVTSTSSSSGSQEQQPRSVSQPSGSYDCPPNTSRSISGGSTFSLLSSSKSLRYSKKKSAISSTVAGDSSTVRSGFSRPLESIFGSLSGSSRRAVANTSGPSHDSNSGSLTSAERVDTHASTPKSTDNVTNRSTINSFAHNLPLLEQHAPAPAPPFSFSSSSRGVGYFLENLMKKGSRKTVPVDPIGGDLRCPSSSASTTTTTTIGTAPMKTPAVGSGASMVGVATITGSVVGITSTTLPSSHSLDQSSTLDHRRQQLLHQSTANTLANEKQQRRWSECCSEKHALDSSRIPLSSRLAATHLNQTQDVDGSRSPTPVASTSPSNTG